jgi:hypothetical protein
MPVYLITAHAYRSWSEGDPNGYVQRREGLKSPSPALARYRAGIAKHPEVRFEGEMQRVLHSTIEAIVPEKGARLHACVTCPTHVHILLSFRLPQCECDGAEYCIRGWEAREFAQDVLIRLKRKMGTGIGEVVRNPAKAMVFTRLGSNAGTSEKSLRSPGHCLSSRAPG